MEAETRELLEKKIAQIEKEGHGAVTLKIMNGCIWRILTLEDTLVLNKKGGQDGKRNNKR